MEENLRSLICPSYGSFLEGAHLGKRDYPSALLEITRMEKPIDDFFDRVIGVVEDEAVRNNRLALLDDIGKVFLRIADFSKLT